MADFSELERRVHAEIAVLAPFLKNNPNIPVTAGVSGGSDSLSLALLLHSFGLNLTVLLVDHALRAESADEAQATAEFLRTKGVKSEIITLNKDEYPKGAGVQERARGARMKALEEASYRIGSPCVFLGHQRDDLIETVAFRDEKDSFSEGLRGIQPSSIYGRVALLRPLLGCTREELKDYLRQQDIKWVSDPSNKNRKYARVRIRQDLTPADRSRLEETRKKATQEHNRSKEAFIAACSDYVTWCDWGGFKVNSEVFNKLNHEDGTFLLRKLISFLSPKHPPAYSAVEKLKEKEAATLGGVRVEKRKGILFLARELRDLPDVMPALKDTLFDGRWRYLGDDNKEALISYLGDDSSAFERSRSLPSFCLKALPVLRKAGKIVAVSEAYSGKHNFAKVPFTWNGKPPLFD